MPLVVFGLILQNIPKVFIRFIAWLRQIYRFEGMTSSVSNRNRNLQTCKAPYESQARGTSLFTSAASYQKGCPEDSP